MSSTKKTTFDDPLFVRVLQFAWDRGSTGFKVDELKDAVTQNEDEWVWVNRMMMGEINGDPPLIFHLGSHNQGGEYKYYLTGSGASALFGYLELKEARQGARRALRWAIASFLLAAIVGIVQIAFSLTQIHSHDSASQEMFQHRP